jgi:excisionase family DNA binding protein
VRTRDDGVVPGLLTADELAELLRVAPTWVIERASRGDLPGYKLGRSWRFDAGEVAEWLTRRGNPPTRTPRSARTVLPDRRPSAPPPAVNLETALRPEDVAATLGVTKDRVRGWVQSGLLPGVVDRGTCLVDRDGFEQWLAILGDPVHRWEQGRVRTGAIRDTIESAILAKVSRGLSPTPGSLRRSGGTIPRWSQAFPSGRR